MKSTKKFLSIILAILMVISIIPITAGAETPTSGICGDNLTWTYNSSNGYLTISGTGPMYDFESNNPPWESYEDSIKEVVVEDGVTTIGNYAFYHCGKLITVTLPDSVTTIGEDAFCFCRGLTNVSIGKGVTTINRRAFSYCDNLTSVTIPESVTVIEETVFSGCENLSSITVDSDSEYFANDEYGVLFNKDKTMLIQYPAGSTETNYTIPDSVIKLCEESFLYCFNIESVTIPDSITTIGRCAFSYYKQTIKLYYNGTSNQWNEILENNADTADFLADNYVVHCTDKTLYPSGICGDNLTWSYDTHSNTLIISGTGAMYNYEYDFGGFGTYPWVVFAYDVEHVIIKDGATSIGVCAFVDFQNLIDIQLSDSVTLIDEDAFAYCYNLKDVYFTGTEEQWNGISIDSYNQPLLNATIHYDYCIHEYNPVVTPPSCTEQGYTTYTCECGDSYVDDYIEALGHTEEILPAVAPTCTETGLTEGVKCSVCGETLTEQKELPAIGHTPATAVEENYVAPTCTSNGSVDKVVYCSVCNAEIIRETVTLETTGHTDVHNDGICDSCDLQLCDHICHKEGITGIIWRIINVFNMLFGLNKTCECGVAHY